MTQTRSSAKAASDKHGRYQTRNRASIPDSLMQRGQRNQRSTTPRDMKTGSSNNCIQVF
jgi:hypothetical protein